MNLFGKNYKRIELMKKIGREDQIAGIRDYKLHGGRGDNVRILEVKTGGGLSFQVCPDKCLDIYHAEYKGKTISVHSCSGMAHPAYFDKDGLEWVNTFEGGLLATCGLHNTGGPSSFGGKQYGLHGGIHTTPSEITNYTEEWEGQEYVMKIHGKMREGALHSSNLVLYRTISTKMGSNSFIIEDTLENQGFVKEPYLILYHCNLGFPLVDEGTKIEIDAEKTTPRTEDARKGFDRWNVYEAPSDAEPEQVFFHEGVKKDETGLASARITNKEGLSVRIRYSGETLPVLVEWKDFASGLYALGIEPSNSKLEGMQKAYDDKTICYIEPFEKVCFMLEFTVSD